MVARRINDRGRSELPVRLTEDVVEQPPPEIVVLDLDGHVLLHVPLAEAPTGGLSWSPDGTKVLFTRSEGDHDAVYWIDVSSGRERMLVYG